MTHPAPESPPATLLLRSAVLTAALASAYALAASGLLSTGGGLLLAWFVVVAALGPGVFPRADGLRFRRAGAVGALGLSVLVALVYGRQLDGGAAFADLPWQLGPRVTVLAAGLLVAQLLLGDRQREVLVSLLVADSLVVFGLAAAPGPAVGAALLLAWPATVAALAVAHVARARMAADVRAVADDGHAGAPVAPGAVVTVVVGSVLVGLLVVLLGPQPDGLQPGASGLPGAGSPDAGTSTSRDVTAYTHGTLDLRTRGDLPEVPVADVPAGSPGLWLGSTLSLYDGTTWRASGAGVVTGPPLQGAPPYLLPPDPQEVVTAVRTDRVNTREGFGGVLLAPGHPVGLDVPVAVFPISGGWFLAGSTRSGAPTSYAVTSSSRTPPVAALRAAVAHPAAEPAGPSIYTVLPDTVPERVRELGRRLTAGATTRYDATVAVERYLRRHATYRLDSPVPPPGADAVDHFLFSARTGFCEQFASAEVVLLRASGIPARLATGFSGGEVDGDRRTLRGSDAHAWVEVLYPGVGWASSDPTAGTELAQDTGLLDRLEELMRDGKGRALLAGLLVAAVLAGWALAWVLGRVLRRWWLGRVARNHRRQRPLLLAAFDRLEEALARTGMPRAPSETVGELGRRARLTPVAGALDVVERTCYSGAPPSAADTAAAARELDDLSRRLLEDA